MNPGWSRALPRQARQRFRTLGFTLLELMVAVAILGILVAIAMPNYRDYRVRANRAAAQSVVLEIASRQRQYFLDARRFFDNKELAALGYYVPDDVSRHYDISIDTTSPPGQPPRFVIRATPKPESPQASDGELAVDHLSRKTRGGVEW